MNIYIIFLVLFLLIILVVFVVDMLLYLSLSYLPLKVWF